MRTQDENGNTITHIRLSEDDGMGKIIEIADMHGWDDTFGSADKGDWSPAEADACEEAALDYLRDKNIRIYDHEGVCLNRV